MRVMEPPEGMPLLILFVFLFVIMNVEGNLNEWAKYGVPVCDNCVYMDCGIGVSKKTMIICCIGPLGNCASKACASRRSSNGTNE